MKLPLILAGLCLAAPTLAQGVLKFSNYSTVDGIIAPVFDSDGVTRLGSAYYGQLYAGPAESSLAPIGSAIPFKDAGNVGSGFIIGGSVTVPTVPDYSKAFVQLRAWEASGGTSFEAAQAASSKTGESPVFQVVVGSRWIGLPAPLTGLQSFALVPEPAPAWLLAVGLAAFALARRQG